MFAIFCPALVSRRNRVLAYNFAVEAHRGTLAASSIPKHFSGSGVRFGLSVVNTRRTVGIVQLIDPLAVFATVNSSII